MHVYCTDKIRMLQYNSHSPVNVAENSLPSHTHSSLIKSKQSSSSVLLALCSVKQQQTGNYLTVHPWPDKPEVRLTDNMAPIHRSADKQPALDTSALVETLTVSTFHKVIWMTEGRAERRRCRIPQYFLTRILRYCNYPHVVKKVRRVQKGGAKGGGNTAEAVRRDRRR